MKSRIGVPALIALVLSGSLWLFAQIKEFRPVTEAMLRNPAPGDWLNWRRTDNAWGYSPLDQIKRDNVQKLQLAWSWAMEDGAQESTPLVHDGIMYLPNPHGVIQALDAATGDLIWEYQPKVREVEAPTGSVIGGVQRNIAIYDDKVFGTTNDAHIIAVDARTGKLVWETVVADSKQGYGYTSGPIVVRGKVIAGINGCSRQIDRTNGTFVHATDLGYQNLVEVGPETGKVTYRPDKIPKIGVEVDICPSTAGFKDWRAMSFSPQTNALYIPMSLTCERATFGEVEKVLGKGGNGPVRRIDYKFPAGGGNLGEFLALDLKSGKVLWRQRMPTPFNTAALTTAGGLAFGGDWDRHLFAYDVSTGKILWQTRLLTSAQGFPISYMAKGKQYVAIPVGTGGGSWATSVPASLAREIRPPKAVNAMFVYALP